MQGFIDRFPMPVSRHTQNKKDEIIRTGLEILAFSPSSGVGMVRCPETKDLFILNHLEYDACLLYTSPSPRDGNVSRMPSSA